MISVITGFALTGPELTGPVVMAQAASQGLLHQMMPMLLILAVFYFLLIRPQQKRAQEHSAFIGGLKRGDKVVTTGGLHGRILEVKENEVVLEISQGVKVRYQRDKIAAGENGGKEE